MQNDWFSTEEGPSGNPSIFVESTSCGTICEITGGEIEHRRARAELIAKAPALQHLPRLLAACEKAKETYFWLLADWADKLDPDGQLDPEYEELRQAVTAMKAAVGDIPDIFEDL